MAVTVASPRPMGMSYVSMTSQLSFYLLLVYLFVLYSRLAENLTALHIPMVLMICMTALLLLDGGLGRALFNRVGLPMAGFTLWFIMAIPFSVWRGGSVESVMDWLKSFAVLLIMMAFLTDMRRCRMAIYSVAAGILWVGILGLISGSVQLNRLSLQIGRFGDANDFAQILLVGMALSCYLTSRQGRGAIGKVVFAVVFLIELIAFSRSGSRGGLIGLILTSFVLFCYSTLAGRIKLITTLAALLVLITAFLPRSVINRYRSIFTEEQEVTSEEDYVEQQAALGSRKGRTYLLKTSLAMTLQHPLFGVGPGMFMVAENDKAKDLGQIKGMWHETHNMYTQVSSEAGIPALIFFCLALFGVVRDCNLIRKRRQFPSEREPTPEQAHMAFWLNIAMWSVLTSGFFLSVAYTPELQGLLALVAAFARAVHQENALPLVGEPVRALPLQRISTRSLAEPVGFYGIPKTGY